MAQYNGETRGSEFLRCAARSPEAAASHPINFSHRSGSQPGRCLLIQGPTVQNHFACWASLHTASNKVSTSHFRHNSRNTEKGARKRTAFAVRPLARYHADLCPCEYCPRTSDVFWCAASEEFKSPAFWFIGCLTHKSELKQLRFVLFTAVCSADLPLFLPESVRSNPVLGQK